MKRNPREITVNDAEVEFREAFLAIEKKYELTYGEMFEILGRRTTHLAMNLVSDEREEKP